MTRASAALALANARYWSTVAPLVGMQLRHWTRRAHAIPDPELRAIALGKLREEHFNAQVAATLATQAPSCQRVRAIRAIVALEVMYDYLDGLTERPMREPLRDGEQLFRAFTDALAPPGTPHAEYYPHHPTGADGGYLLALSAAARESFWQLPSAATIAARAQASATRCAQGQVHVHAGGWSDEQPLRGWAQREASSCELGWREFLAGAAASVLAVHALVVASAQPGCSREHATQIDELYLRVCALSTMLDSLVDRELDEARGTPSCLRLFADGEELGQALVRTARSAFARARGLRSSPHHLMIVAGVVAYYTSTPGAREPSARWVVAEIERELWPLILPALATMHAWRAAKRARRHLPGRVSAGVAEKAMETR